MKAAIFETPGLDNLKVIDNAEDPKINDHDILIKVKTAGVNPIDHLVVSGMLPKISTLSAYSRSRVERHRRTDWKSC